VQARRAAALDAALYGASALIAAATLRIDVAPVYREWGRFAVGPYAVAAAIATGLALRRRPPAIRVRIALAVAVFVGAALLPMSLEIAWRDRGPRPDSHTNSEPIITEEAARALVHGRDPYAEAFLHGPLAAWPIGTKTHYPYLPAMLLFGLPRAAAPQVPAADARAAFLAGSLALLAVSLRRWKATDLDRLLVFQVLVVLPTGALLLSGGGDDLPVVATMLLSLVLLDEGLTGWAGAAAGVAAAMKQLAWPFVPLLVSTAWKAGGRAGRREGAKASIGAAGVVAGIVGPFIVWHPGALFDDVVRFPLGYGKPKTFHPTPTPGVLFVRAFPGARGALAALVATILLGLLVYLVVRRGRAGDRTPSPGAKGSRNTSIGTNGGRNASAGADVARATALVLLVAILLAPSSRIGFFIYPINLLVWARSMDRVRRRRKPLTSKDSDAVRPA
jgi:hypothetical protein